MKSKLMVIVRPPNLVNGNPSLLLTMDTLPLDKSLLTLDTNWKPKMLLLICGSSSLFLIELELEPTTKENSHLTLLSLTKSSTSKPTVKLLRMLSSLPLLLPMESLILYNLSTA
jgi:hypothetical protein